MEFGPRALGARSILGDPRSPTMQKMLNLKVKYRESFRPFAPSVLREDVADWFELDADSPYMLLVAPVKESHRRAMSDGRAARCSASTSSTCRAPTFRPSPMSTIRRASRPCTPDTNPRFHALIARFKALTGCPVLVNTSFNVRGEPIVCTPEDAFRCFMGTEIEMLAVGNCILRKERAGPGAETGLQRRVRTRLNDAAGLKRIADYAAAATPAAAGRWRSARSCIASDRGPYRALSCMVIVVVARRISCCWIAGPVRGARQWAAVAGNWDDELGWPPPSEATCAAARLAPAPRPIRISRNRRMPARRPMAIRSSGATISPLPDGWIEQLSRKLGCRVANYGVHGYGTDQAYVRFTRMTAG